MPSASNICRPRTRRPAWPISSPPIASACWSRPQAPSRWSPISNSPASIGAWSGPTAMPPWRRLVLIGMAAALLAQRAAREGARGRGGSARASGTGNPLARFFVAAYAAFADFSRKTDALLILLFVVLYKLTDTFAGVMTGPFVLDIGFDKASYAAIVKGVGPDRLAARRRRRAACSRAPCRCRARCWWRASCRRWRTSPSPGSPGSASTISALARRHLDGEFHQRDRHGRVHRLSLGAVHQPGAYRDAIRAAHRARLVRPHHSSPRSPASSRRPRAGSGSSCCAPRRRSPGSCCLWLLTKRGAFTEIEQKEKLAEASG